MKTELKSTLYTLAVIFTVLHISCREDFMTTTAHEKLYFSKDTVYLDTVFDNIGSATYSLKVYNRATNAVAIPSIQLGRGQSSFYRLNVDGNAGNAFFDVEIAGKDSIYIFIETTIDYQNAIDPIYMDSIVFSGGSEIQDVKLITLVKDAYFLFPSKNASGLKETIPISQNTQGETISVSGFYLEENTVFTAEKPYVIYGYCAVSQNNTLIIEPGASIHFHKNSGLIIEKNASLLVQGTGTNKVLFQGDRLESDFDNIPGQWGGIWIRAGSFGNQINFAEVKNATLGIIADSIGSTSVPTLKISNTEIYNSSQYGLLGRESAIDGENIVINNSGKSSLALTMGGDYNFTHGTFGNFWYRGFREYPAVLINNYYSYVEGGTQFVISKDLHNATFTNCIIDGNANTELLLDPTTDGIFNYTFRNNLIRYNGSNTQVAPYDFDNSVHYSDNIFNGNPDFGKPDQNYLIIGELSEGVGKGLESGTTSVPYDILGVLRSIPGDIGAYQHIILDR